jgi:hypothetical protein
VKTEIAGTTSAYSGSPTGLTIFWLEVLELAHGGDDEGVAQRLAMLALRRDDLEELFGKGAATRLWSEYARAFASFAADGARDIAKKIRERRYDDVEVHQVNGSRPEPRAGSLAGDHAEPLRTNLPVFTVRLKRTDEADGIRIDTFVYLDGSWRTALKVGRSK